MNPINLQQRRQNMQWRKYSPFNKGCLENWIATWKRNKLDYSLTSSKKINSNSIKFLLKFKTWKQKTSRKNLIGNTLFDTGLSNIPCPWGNPRRAGHGGEIWKECGPLEKGMANHFSILALRTPWTVCKGKMLWYW